MYAYQDADDDAHTACRDLIQTHRGPLIVPVLVVAEVAYLVARRLGASTEVRFLGDLSSGALIPEPVDARDWHRIAELVWRYADFPLGTTDASVIAAAERLGISQIATLDRRHFGAVRPAHVDALELLP